VEIDIDALKLKKPRRTSAIDDEMAKEAAAFATRVDNNR
jgi:hypothetical protein